MKTYRYKSTLGSTFQVPWKSILILLFPVQVVPMRGVVKKVFVKGLFYVTFSIGAWWENWFFSNSLKLDVWEIAENEI